MLPVLRRASRNMWESPLDLLDREFARALGRTAEGNGDWSAAYRQYELFRTLFAGLTRHGDGVATIHYRPIGEYQAVKHQCANMAVATELPDSITEPDIAERMRKAYEGAIPADSFARMVAFAVSQPEDVDVNEILCRPTSQEY